MTLSEQLSLRITAEQRQFVQDELAEMKKDPRAAKLCEADIIRAFIEEARLKKVHATLDNAQAGA